MTKIEELGDTEIGNNEDLLKYINRARRIDHTLYLEFHWMAEQLEVKLSSIKGVLNRRRARVIAQYFRVAAELHKESATSLQNAWLNFERQFAKELSAVKKPVKDDFNIV